MSSSNAQAVSAFTSESATIFSKIKLAPADPILGLVQEFNADPRTAQKQNLGPGVYMDERGLTLPLTVVQKARDILNNKPAKEGYLNIDGNPSFNTQIRNMVFGTDSVAIKEGRVVTVQAVGGTGAVSLAAQLLRRFYSDRVALVSDPTWPNHVGIFTQAGFEVQKYPYYNEETRTTRFDQFLHFLQSLPQQAIVVLHACCHNPTGTDFTQEQWQRLADFFARSSHIAVIDTAYQGFKDGLEEDAYPIRLFERSGISFFVASSLSKSFSLYSQRVGALSIVTQSKQEADALLSQVKTTVRSIWSNPPAYGAALVSTVLESAELRSSWEQELATMRNRIKDMRKAFVSGMQKRGQDFSHVLSQHGMFSYTGLTKEQVGKLKVDAGIYMVDTGRIAIPALNPSNIDYVCDAVAKVVQSK